MSLIIPEPSLTGLPDEILVQILSYLTMKSDIYNISQISARLQNVAKDKRIIGTKLDVKGDPNFNEEALAFFVNPTVGDKLQEVNIEGASWINPWQLVKNLPSLVLVLLKFLKRLHFYTLQLYAPLYRRVTTLSRIRVEGGWCPGSCSHLEGDHRARTMICRE